MPHSLDEMMTQADDLANRFDADEPEPGDHDTFAPLTRLRLAALKRNEVEREIAEAVANARRPDTSWKVIGASVGTSGEAARQRYVKRAS